MRPPAIVIIASDLSSRPGSVFTSKNTQREEAQKVAKQKKRKQFAFAK
jgi:hypothetical protein